MKIVQTFERFDEAGVAYLRKDDEALQESGFMEAVESDPSDQYSPYHILSRKNLRFIPDDLVRRIDYQLLNPYFSRISDEFPVDEQYELDRKTRNREQVFDVEGFEKVKKKAEFERKSDYEK